VAECDWSAVTAGMGKSTQIETETTGKKQWVKPKITLQVILKDRRQHSLITTGTFHFS